MEDDGVGVGEVNLEGLYRHTKLCWFYLEIKRDQVKDVKQAS